MGIGIKGLILAAGLGTRLRPLTEKTAKPALPILGVPALWYGAWHLSRSFKLDEVAINISHAPNTVRMALEDPELQKFHPIRFHVSDESDGILGSSGALKKLQDWVGDSTLAVFNGDSIFFPNWNQLLKRHQKCKGLMTLHLREHHDSKEAYTHIEVDEHYRVINFGSKSKSGRMFSGAYLIEPQAIKRLDIGASDLMKTLLTPLSQERNLYEFTENLPWFDTGSITTYARTQFELLKSYPFLKELVTLKMRELKSSCWVPKDWPQIEESKLSAPCVLYGDFSTWKDYQQSLGPEFIGMSGSHIKIGQNEKLNSELAHCVAFENQLLGLAK